MPVQTTVKDFIAIPDGCKVEVNTGSGYTDLGATTGDVTNTLEYDVNKVESANAGTVKVSMRNQRITGGLELMNLNPELVELLGGGMFTRTIVTGAVTPEVQVQTSPAAEVLVEIVMLDSSGNNLRPTAAPAITTVTGGSSGVLTVNVDYDVVADDGSVSGYSIRYESGAITGTEDVTIVYPSQTMNTTQTLKMGKTTDTLTAYAMKFTHTDDNSKIRSLELFSVDTQSGGIQFNFKGATSDGAEVMPITYEAKLDTTRSSGDQLAQWVYETGAE